MLFLQKLGKALLYTIGSFLILTFLVTLGNYINIFGPKFMTFFKIAIPIFSSLLGGIIMGRKALKRGWLEGIKYSAIIIVILVLLNYLGFNLSFQGKQLLFYGIILISTVFGSMIGINLGKQEKN